MKNNILLIYPHFYQYSQWKWLPTGLIFLASTIKEAGFQPILIDDRFSRKETLEKIDKLLPKTFLIGISAATGSQLHNARQLAKYIKEKWNIPIVFGGPFPSAKPKMLLKQEKNIDYVIVGQGERPIIKLAKVIKGAKSRASLHSIPNLFYRDSKGKITQSKAPFPRVDINSLPQLPYFDKKFLNVDGYLNPETRAINYTTSAGCVGNCAFCYWHPSYTRSTFNIDRVIKDLKKMKKKFNILNINFDDPTFFIGRNRIMDLVNKMLNEKLNIAWRANARVDALKHFSLEDMKIIRSAGCEVIHIGLEHTSPKVIQMMGKKIDPNDCLNLLSLSKQTGLIFRFHILLGNPTESIEDLKSVGKFIQIMKKLHPDFDYTVNWFTPYPGCPETFLAQQNGYVPPKTLAGFEKIELMNYIDLPDNDRILVQESNPWEIDYKVPWFSKEFNTKYVQTFRRVIPRKEYFQSTAGKVESQYKQIS